MAEEIYMGFDPGKTGYLFALTKEGVEIDSIVMPITKSGEIDGKGIFDWINRVVLEYSDSEVIVYVEDVHATFGSAAEATFSFGRNVGALHSAIQCTGLSFYLVQPKVWQSIAWKGQELVKMKKKPKKTDTKAVSLNAATELFPDIDLRKNSRCRVAHDGKVDSLLICNYGRLMHKKLHSK